jgi:hypothetical protein
MRAETGNGELELVIVRCRATHACCEEYLSRLGGTGRPEDAMPATIRCVALLSLIADRLESGLPCPLALVDEAVRTAHALPADGFGCATACAAAAEALAGWVDSAYERG